MMSIWFDPWVCFIFRFIDNRILFLYSRFETPVLMLDMYEIGNQPFSSLDFCFSFFFFCCCCLCWYLCILNLIRCVSNYLLKASAFILFAVGKTVMNLRFSYCSIQFGWMPSALGFTSFHSSLKAVDYVNYFNW